MAQDIIISTQTEPQAVLPGYIIACPMLNVRPVAPITSIGPDVTDIILTSRHALTDPDYVEMIDDRPCWCVGETTRSIAEMHGLNIAETGSSDVQALAEILPDDKKYAHLGAEILSPQTPKAFADQQLNVQHIVTYRTEEIKQLPEAILRILKSEHCSQVMFFSARAGTHWNNLIDTHQLTHTLREIKALCLSPRVLQSVDNLPWIDVQLAAEPRIQAMTDLISHVDKT